MSFLTYKYFYYLSNKCNQNIVNKNSESSNVIQ